MKKLLYCGLALLAVAVAVAAFFPALLVVGLGGISAARLGVERQTVAVGELEWVYNRVGDGEPLVLLHGFGASKESWNAILPHLSKGFSLIVVDLPGFGESSKDGSLSYDVRSQADRLHSFAEAIGLESFHLGGNSMGGSIAGEFAAKYPDTVRSLWLISTAGVQAAQPSAFDLHFRQGGENVMIARNVQEFDRQMAWLFHTPPATPTLIKRGIVSLIGGNAASAEKAHRDLIADWPALERSLSGFAKPVLITWGAEDKLVDLSAAKILQDTLPQSQLYAIAGCGHVPMMEHPAITAAHFTAFASALDASAQNP